MFDTLPSAFDTLLAVYTGSDVSALVEVASNDDAVLNIWDQTTRSLVAFVATEGTTYLIAVDGFNAKHGRTILRWRNGVANDFFEVSQALTGVGGKVDGQNVWATMQPDEPSPSDSLASVWYEWTAPATQLVKFSTLGAHFDSVLAVYSGTSVDGLTEIASNDDDPLYSCCASSFVGFEAVAGTSYRVAVGGWSGLQGSFTLSWSPLILGTAGSDLLVGTAGSRGDSRPRRQRRSQRAGRRRCPRGWPGERPCVRRPRQRHPHRPPRTRHARGRVGRRSARRRRRRPRRHPRRRSRRGHLPRRAPRLETRLLRSLPAARQQKRRLSGAASRCSGTLSTRRRKARPRPPRP